VAVAVIRESLGFLPSTPVYHDTRLRKLSLVLKVQLRHPKDGVKTVSDPHKDVGRLIGPLLRIYYWYKNCMFYFKRGPAFGLLKTAYRYLQVILFFSF
jgi:hypothetical protein